MRCASATTRSCSRSAWASGSAHAPELEEDIALTNIALDLLGQARALLTRAGELEGEGRDEDDLAYLRERPRVPQRRCSSSSPTATSPTRSPASSCFSTYQLALYDRLRDSADPIIAGVAGEGGQGGRLPPRPRARSGRCASATAPTRAIAACRRASTGCGRSRPSCSSTTRSPSASSPRGSPPTRASCARRGSTTSGRCSRRRRSTIPETNYAATGGRRGEHSEALGHLLAVMQSTHRAYPGATW